MTTFWLNRYSFFRIIVIWKMKKYKAIRNSTLVGERYNVLDNNRKIYGGKIVLHKVSMVSLLQLLGSP